MQQRTLMWLVVLVVSTPVVPDAAGQGWPQWRGPNRDGVVTSFHEPVTWPDALTQHWTVEVGLGYATPLLVGDRVYVYTRQDDDEVMVAIDARDGSIIWRTSYPAPFDMSPATARHRAGPKSTPVFADGRLFTLGMSGIVSAFSVETGRLLWQKPAPSVHPHYHTAMSPVVDGDLVMFHVGGHNDGALTAFDVENGEIRWSVEGDGPAYGSPMVFELEGTRQVVTFTQAHLVGVEVATGELLWRRPYTTPNNTTAQTPILYGDTVIETGRTNGITAFRVVKRDDGWTTEDVWHTDEVSLHMTNGVVTDGVLFGLSHLNSGQYFGLDLETGQVLWRSDPRQAENVAIVRAGDTIFALEDDAELIILRSSRTGFEPVKRYDVAMSETWAQPTISGSRLFIKDISSLTLWSLD